jgi:hypothetical protein
METNQTLNNGPAAAAMLAAGIGNAVFGVIVCLSENSKAVENFLTFSKPVGALSGKTDLTVIIWLISWLILAAAWKNRQVNLGKVMASTMVLIAFGLLGTFPPFFDML